MAHEDEYDDAMVALLELIWGAGFMAPGGPGNVERMVQGLALDGGHVLDIGCGIGGPAFVLAERFGARVTGIDLEAPLIGRARRAAAAKGLAGQCTFRVVEPGPLDFPDASFDVVFSSGAFTQTADKLGMFRECLRVLRPGGWLTCYDWMKCEGEYSEDMHYWFRMEGLTYAMETPERHRELMQEAGFADVSIEDGSDWYRRRARAEYDQLAGPLYERAVELIGRTEADRFVEDWRAMTVVCDKGEMLQVYCRGRRPR